MVKNLLVILSVVCLTISARAGEQYERYRLKSHSVVVGERDDMVQLIQLNEQGKKKELRALYTLLKSQHGLVDAPSGIIVEVVNYFGTAVGKADIVQIKWEDFGNCPFKVGYIARSDLEEKVSSR